MGRFSGLETQLAVGEIRALRTFRLADDGRLYPLYSATPWRAGANTATCHRDHDGAAGGSARVPAEGCTCGYYAYGRLAYAREESAARHVLAVVAASGTVIAGTRGIRAQTARIEALWLGRRAGDELAAQVGARYPGVPLFRDRDRMLAAHPLTDLESYRPAVPDWAGRLRWVGTALVLLTVALGSLPSGVVRSHPALAWLLGVCAVGQLARLALHASLRRPLAATAAASLTLWALAEPLPLSDQVVLRLPLLVVAGVGASCLGWGPAAVGVPIPPEPVPPGSPR